MTRILKYLAFPLGIAFAIVVFSFDLSDPPFGADTKLDAVPVVDAKDIDTYQETLKQEDGGYYQITQDGKVYLDGVEQSVQLPFKLPANHWIDVYDYQGQKGYMISSATPNGISTEAFGVMRDAFTKYPPPSPTSTPKEVSFLDTIKGIFYIPTAHAAYGLTQSLDLESGSSQYASRADEAALSITGDITLEAWINLETALGAGEIIPMSKWTGSGNQRSYVVEMLDTGTGDAVQLRTSSTGAGGGAITTANVDLDFELSTATWYHLAVTKSGTTVTVYIDGTSHGTATGAASQFDSTAIFAVGQASSAGYFDGKVSLVRVWNTARSQADIDANKCNVYGTATSNMQAEWSLDNVYTDGSGNGFTLTAVNSPVFATDVPSTCAGGGGGGAVTPRTPPIIF